MSHATSRKSLAILLAALAMAPLAANADIGGIGSPVEVSNPPPADDDGQNEKIDPATVARAAQAPQVLLSLRFDQPPHYERQLKEAIEASRKNKPNGFYQVVSYVPSTLATAEAQQAGDIAAANLALVAKQMQDLGVPREKMQVDTEPSGAASYQEIRIFVY